MVSVSVWSGRYFNAFVADLKSCFAVFPSPFGVEGISTIINNDHNNFRVFPSPFGVEGISTVFPSPFGVEGISTIH